MRHVLFCLLLLPSIVWAEISLVRPSLQAELVGPVGRAFDNREPVIVRTDGEHIAVMEVSTDTIYLFQRQADGSWLPFAALPMPDPQGGLLRDFDYDGRTIAFSRLNNSSGESCRIYRVQQIEPNWRTFGSDLAGIGYEKVMTRNGWVAFASGNDVRLWSRDSQGLEVSTTIAGVLGNISYLVGLPFAMDGNRILIGSNERYGTDLYSGVVMTGYLRFDGLLYERDASENWEFKKRIPTEFATPDGGVTTTGHLSLADGEAALKGRTFHSGPYGDWTNTGDFSDPLPTLASTADFQLLGDGLAIRTGSGGQDLYRLGGSGYWEPVARVSYEYGSIVTARGNVAVLRRDEAAGPRFYVLDLSLIPPLAPRPATILGPDVREAAVVPAGQVQVTASAWAGSDGARIRSIEAGIYTNSFGLLGGWHALLPFDGAFDDAYEVARGMVPTGIPDFFRTPQQARVLIRVTDTQGRVTEMLDTMFEPGSAIEILDPIVAGSEHEDPDFSSASLASERVRYGDTNVVYGFAEDSPSGTIQALHFRIDNGVWRGFKPYPGSSPDDFHFNRQWASAQGIFPPATVAGPHKVWMRAVDSAGNVTTPWSLDYTVVP